MHRPQPDQVRWDRASARRTRRWFPLTDRNGALSLIVLLVALQSAHANGLVLHLPFDGSAVPAVGGELGTPDIHGTPAYVEGRHGQGIALTGGAYVVAPLPPCVQSGDFTLAFWMKPLWHQDDGLPHPVVEFPSRPENRDTVGWAPGQLLISKGWSDTISPDFFYGLVDAGIARLHLKPNQWVHLVVCYSAKGKFIAGYTDGEGLRRPQTEMRPLDLHQNRMWLGSRDDGRGGGDIVLDDLRIYDRAIDQAEIPQLAGVEFPPPRDYLRLGTECDPARAVETPHTKWAKPYAGGRLKVLCVGEGVRARDFIELAQRLDLDLLTVTGPAIGEFTLKNPESFLAMGRRVEELLAAGGLDCVVIGSFGWNLFADTTREALLAHVRNGGGLLFAAPRCTGAPADGCPVNAGGGLWLGWERTAAGKPVEELVHRLDRADEEYLTGTIPWHLNAHFATFMEHSQPWMLFRGGTVGKGRVLLYDVHTDSTYGWVSLTPALCWMASFDLKDYDYAVGAAAKAVLWAAGRDSPVRITSIRYGSDTQFFRNVTVGLAGRWQVSVLNGTAEPRKAQVRLRAATRVADVPFEAQTGVTLQPGPNTVDIPHTMDRIGQVFADVSVLLDGKVADWATAAVLTGHGNPWFTSLAVDQEAYEPGDQPQVTAGVALKTYGKSTGETGSADWRLFDAYDRIVARGREPARFDPYDEITATVTWALPRLSGHSLRYQLAVDLVRNGRVSDQRTVELVCRQKEVDDYVFYAWGGVGAPGESLGAMLLRDRYGLTGIGVSFGNAVSDGPELLTDLARNGLRWASRLNVRPWIYATHLGGHYDDEKQRDLDLADTQLRSGLEARLRTIARICKPYSPLFYGLGDEVCQGPPEAAASGYELEAFRRYLKTKYGKIEALNQVWETDYKYWRDVQAQTPEQHSGDKLNPRAYTEITVFRDSLFADLAAACTQAVRSVDAGAAVGTEGIFGLGHHWGNFDYSKLCEQVTFMGQYALGMEMDMVRSFQRPGDLLGCWYNYNKLDREYSLLGPWHVLLRGARCFGWYTITEGSQYAALNPDFTAFEQFAWTWEELEPLLAGIGKLVIGLDRDDPGVYLLYDHRNLSRYSPWFLSMMTFTMLLQDLGLPLNFVSNRQIERGALTNPAVKALVLPGQFAMDMSVAKAIREFVNRGGVAIADESVAVADGFKRYEARPLDDLFAAQATLKGKLLPESDQDLADWQTHQKTVGRGTTLFFGGTAADYRRARLSQPGQLMRRIVAEFLAAPGIAPAFSVRPVDRAFLPIDVVSYHDGNSRYVAMQRSYKIADPSAQPFRVTGPAPAHVYNVRSGTYVGQSNTADLTLEVARGALLAFLPYKATELRIEGLPESLAQGDTADLLLALDTEGATPAGGVFRILVRGPAGEAIAALGTKVRSLGGVARIPLTIAVNDPAGAWTLEAVDVATGLRQTRKFEVRSRNG